MTKNTLNKPLMLELFSGSGNMARAFREQGFKTLTIDKDFEADIQKDIRKVTPQEIIKALGGRPSVIWASPPCTAFSVAAISKNWTEGKPSSDNAFLGIELLAHTLRLIIQLQPDRWYIENPRAMMRKLPIIEMLPRRTLSFCQYGDNAMKPTDIFTNNLLFSPKMCNNGDPCHDRQPRGYKKKKEMGALNKGTQGKKNAYDRGVLPYALCQEVAKFA